LLSAALATAACGGRSQTTRVVDITGINYAFQAPATLAPGPARVRFVNAGTVPHEVQFFVFKAGLSPDSVRALLNLEHFPDSLVESLDTVISVLREQLSRLLIGELLAFDRMLERKLSDIDRADIHEQTGGSEDGFLYCRGLIVALGRGYYEAVQRNPAVAVVDAECREICYLSWNLYQERFGEVPASEISRESCSNVTGWPADAEELVIWGRAFVMGVRQAIRKAEALLPRDLIGPENDKRWGQAMLAVGDYVESEPEAVWQFIRRWGGHPLADVRGVVACVLLEHLLEYHFEVYFPQVENLAMAEPLFGDMFVICWPLGQTAKPGNRERFESLRDRLRGGGAAEPGAAADRPRE